MGLCFPQTQHYFLLCFLLKFSLTISSCLICFAFTLQSFCDRSRARNLTDCSSITSLTGPSESDAAKETPAALSNTSINCKTEVS